MIIVFYQQLSNFQLHHGENKLHFDDIRFVLDKHDELACCSATFFVAHWNNSQQSEKKHVAPLGHIILSKLVFTL